MLSLIINKLRDVRVSFKPKTIKINENFTKKNSIKSIQSKIDLKKCKLINLFVDVHVFRSIFVLVILISINIIMLFVHALNNGHVQ